MNQGLSATKPIANNASDCAIDAASPAETGAAEPVPNCSKNSCDAATSTETSPRVTLDLDDVIGDAVRYLFVLAGLSIISLPGLAPDSIIARFVFCVSVIAVLTICVIAVTAIIRSPANFKKSSMRGLL